MSTTSQERIVPVEIKPNPYPVIITEGALATLGARLREQFPSRRVMVVTDENVGPLHAEKAMESLRHAGLKPGLVTIPPGDATKSLDWAGRLYDELADARIDRSSPVVAVGGGVVGDLTGFVAATWMRGVPFVQCPTTLEADVDASVGGKTGVNHPCGKNMVGSFYQPKFVLIDTLTLSTLSKRDFLAGLSESVKHAIIKDADFFDWHEANAETILSLDMETLGELVERNVRIKASVVAEDEREVSGQRALLNFGHTIGHAVEAAMMRQGHPWRHGEAISVGMVAAAEMSVVAGKLERIAAERIVALLEKIGLPTHAPLGKFRDDLLKLMHADKKAHAGRVRFVLADRIGQATLYDDIQPEWIDAGLDRAVR